MVNPDLLRVPAAQHSTQCLSAHSHLSATCRDPVVRRPPCLPWWPFTCSWSPPCRTRHRRWPPKHLFRQPTGLLLMDEPLPEAAPLAAVYLSPHGKKEPGTGQKMSAHGNHCPMNCQSSVSRQTQIPTIQCMVQCTVCTVHVQYTVQHSTVKCTVLYTIHYTSAIHCVINCLAHCTGTALYTICVQYNIFRLQFIREQIYLGTYHKK